MIANEHLTMERQYRVSLIVYGGGSEEKRAEIAAHIARCGEGCKELLAEEEENRRAIESEPPPVESPEEKAARNAALTARRLGLERAIAWIAELDAAAAAAEATGGAKVVRLPERSPAPLVIDREVAETRPAQAASEKVADIIPIERARRRWRRLSYGTATLAAAGWLFALVQPGAQLASTRRPSTAASGGDSVQDETVDAYTPEAKRPAVKADVAWFDGQLDDAVRAARQAATVANRPELLERLTRDLGDPKLAAALTDQLVF